MSRHPRPALAGFVAGALLLLAPAAARAQCASATVCTVVHSVSVPTVLKLTVAAAPTTGSTVTTTVLPQPTEADLDAGFATSTGPTLTVKANRAWLVTVTADASWGLTGGTRTTPKPAADLLWNVTGLGNAFSNNVGTAASFGGTAGSSDRTMFYKVLYDFAQDVPGTYSINVNFTLTAP